MKKQITIIFLLLFSLFLFSSCTEKEEVKASDSVPVSFNIEGLEKAERIVVSAKEKDTGEKVKIKITPGEENKKGIRKGIYVISNVSSEDKRTSVSLNEPYFIIDGSRKKISLSVKEEIEKGALEWFFYNNSIYLLCLVGCSVFLGISKWKENRKERMR